MKVTFLRVVFDDLHEDNGVYKTSIIDLFDPDTLSSTDFANYSVYKSTYGRSLSPRTWIGSQVLDYNNGPRDIPISMLEDGSWRFQNLTTDSGFIRDERFVDTSAQLNIISFSGSSDIKMSVISSDLSDELEDGGGYQSDEYTSANALNIIDADRYAILAFSGFINETFEVFIRLEIGLPAFSAISSSTRTMLNKFPNWMSIRDLPELESDTIQNIPSDNLAGSFLNSVASQWIEDINKQVSYREMQHYAQTADTNQTAWIQRSDTPNEPIWSVKGDGSELTRTFDINELRQAYSIYVQDDIVEVDRDDACFIDYANGSVLTQKSYEDFTVNGVSTTQNDFHIWNYFDEMGTLVDLPRLWLEDNESYVTRILDVYKNRGGVGVVGLKNALRRELNLWRYVDSEFDGFPEIYTMEELESSPDYFDADGNLVQDEHGHYPFLDLAKKITQDHPSTWGYFRWDKALWDHAGEDYIGYGLVPYRLDAEDLPANTIQAGVGDGDDLYVYRPDHTVGPETFEWTIKARSRTQLERPSYAPVRLQVDIMGQGEKFINSNPIKRIWLTAEVVTAAGSYYKSFEISTKSDATSPSVEPSANSYATYSIFREDQNTTIEGFANENGVLYLDVDNHNFIHAADITNVDLHLGNAVFSESGVTFEDVETEDEFEVWFSHDPLTVLDHNGASIAFVWSDQFSSVVMKSLVVDSGLQTITTDPTRFDLVLNNVSPYDQPNSVQITIPKFLWPAGLDNISYRVQLITKNSYLNPDGNTITEYGALTQTGEGETWFLPSEVINVNDNNTWSEDGNIEIDITTQTLVFDTNIYGFYPGEDIFPDEDIYPSGRVQYPVPEKYWEYSEHYLLEAPDSEGERAILYSEGTVDENGPWRYGIPVAPGATDNVLDTLNGLTRYNFDIANADNIEIAWLSVELKESNDNVLTWLESNVVSREDPLQDVEVPENAIKENRLDDGVYQLESFPVLARRKPLSREWYPWIHSGTFYTQDEEYYLFADSRTEIETNDARALESVTRQGAPVIVSGNRVGTSLYLDSELESYAKSESKNLLIGEEWSLSTSVSGWESNAGMEVSFNQEITPVVGAGALQARVIEDGNNRGIRLSRKIEVDPSSPYSLSFYAQSTTQSILFLRARFRWYDDVDNLLTTTNSGTQAFETNDWNQFHFITQSIPTAATVQIIIDIYREAGTQALLNDFFYLDYVSFYSGHEEDLTPSYNLPDNLDLRIHGYFHDAPTSGESTLIAKASSAEEFSYRFYMISGGLLRFEWNDGDAIQLAGTSTPISSVDDAYWLRVSFRGDIGGAGRVRFYWSQTGETWDGIDIATNLPGGSQIAASRAPLEIGAGSDSTGNFFTGRIISAEVKDVFDGISAAIPSWNNEDQDPEDYSNTSKDILNNTWTWGSGAFVYWDSSAEYIGSKPQSEQLRRVAFFDKNVTPTELSIYHRGRYIVHSESDEKVIYLQYRDMYDIAVIDADDLDSEDPFDVPLLEESTNRLVIDGFSDGDVVEVRAKLRNSFFVDNEFVDNNGDLRSKIVFDKKSIDAGFGFYQIDYEGASYNPVASLDIPLNPLFTSIEDGFLFISQNEYRFSRIEMRLSPAELVADGEDYLVISMRSIDNYGNPKPSQTFDIETTFGDLSTTTVTTDQDGYASVVLTADLLTEDDPDPEYGTVSVVGGITAQEVFGVIIPTSEKSQLIATVSARQIPVYSWEEDISLNDRAYNYIYGKVQTHDFQPVPDLEVNWLKKRSVYELFTPDREGLRLRLDGGVDSYVSGESDNILDADSTHFQQGVGIWSNGVANVGIATSEEESLFGDSSLKASRFVDIGVILVESESIDVTAEVDYTFALSVRPENRARDFQVEIVWFDVGETIISADNEEITESLDEWSDVAVSAQSPVGATTAKLRARWLSCSPGESHFMDRPRFAQSLDDGFTTSLEIHSNLMFKFAVGSTEDSYANDTALISLEENGTARVLVYIDTDSQLRVRYIDSVDSPHISTVAVPAEIKDGYNLYGLIMDSDAGNLTFFEFNETDAWIPIATVFIEEMFVFGEIDNALIGATSTAGYDNFTGDVYFVEIFDGINGPVVAAADFTKSGPWLLDDVLPLAHTDKFGIEWTAAATAEFLSDHDNKGSVTTSEDGTFVVGPISTDIVSGQWFVSLEADLVDYKIGDVVNWYEYPAILKGVENPDAAPSPVLAFDGRKSPRKYSDEYRFTTVYTEDVVLPEVDPDIDWLPPTWYALSAYQQYQLGIDTHDIIKNY